jgi:hypothetical protein
VTETQAKLIFARALTTLGVVALGWSALHVVIMGTGGVAAAPLGETLFVGAPLVPLAAVVASALSPRQRVSLAISAMSLFAFVVFWVWVLWAGRAA